ncbi:MAG: ribonuclease HI [Planctomycetes bacterium]|nr:ribonuclease HI [Planctomycetota bacterium]
MPSAKPAIELYTDGACSGNPGPGGWAYITRNRGTDAVAERSGGEPATTNNRMELMSVIEGLVDLDEPSRVELYSDSQYVCRGLSEWLDQWMARGWKLGRSGNRDVKNVDLWKRLDELRRVHELSTHWIRGHNDHPENDRCDELAVAAAARFSQ